MKRSRVITKSDMMLDPDCYQSAKKLCGLTVGDALELVKFNRVLTDKFDDAKKRFDHKNAIKIRRMQNDLYDEIDAMQALTKEYV